MLLVERRSFGDSLTTGPGRGTKRFLQTYNSPLPQKLAKIPRHSTEGILPFFFLNLDPLMDLWHCGSIGSQMTQQWLCSDTKHISHLAVSPAHLHTCCKWSHVIGSHFLALYSNTQMRIFSQFNSSLVHVLVRACVRDKESVSEQEGHGGVEQMNALCTGLICKG